MSSKSSKTSGSFFKQPDKKAAVTEYEQRRKAEQEKTARLKALRLAKEAADREIAEQEAAAKAAAKKPATKRRKKPVSGDVATG